MLVKIRSSNNIALVVTTTRIATTLLNRGRTAYTRVRIPINIYSSFTYNVKK